MENFIDQNTKTTIEKRFALHFAQIKMKYQPGNIIKSPIDGKLSVIIEIKNGFYDFGYGNLVKCSYVDNPDNGYTYAATFLGK